MYVLRYIDFNCRPVTKLGKDAYLAFCILFYSENCNESRTGGEGNATEDEREFTANLPFSYGAVLSGKSWFVIFFINIHHLVKAIILLYKVYSGL